MTTYKSLIKGAVFGVATVAIAMSTACGKKKGGGAASSAGSAVCVAGNCQIGQAYDVPGMGKMTFVGNGTGSGQVNGQQGLQTVRLVVSAFSNSQSNYGGLNGSMALSGTMSVRAGYGLMQTTSAFPRIPAQVSVGFNYGGVSVGYNSGGYNNGYYAPTYYQEPIVYDPRLQQQYNYTGVNNQSQCYSNPQLCQGNGGYYGGGSNCQLPVGDYTITTRNQGSGSGYNGQVTIQSVQVRLTRSGGGATLDATFTGTLMSNNYYGGQNGSAGTLNGTLMLQQCGTSIQIGSSSNYPY